MGLFAIPLTLLVDGREALSLEDTIEPLGSGNPMETDGPNPLHPPHSQGLPFLKTQSSPPAPPRLQEKHNDFPTDQVLQTRKIFNSPHIMIQSKNTQMTLPKAYCSCIMALGST